MHLLHQPVAAHAQGPGDFGLVALIISASTTLLLVTFPVTYEISAWYSSYHLAALAIYAVVVLYAFRTSLGGRPVFGTPRLDE